MGPSHYLTSLPHLDFDPALGVMTGIPPINPMMPGLGIVPPPIPPDMPAVKEIIHCKSCTLFPPNPRNCLLMFCPVSACLCGNVCVYESVCERRATPLRGGSSSGASRRGLDADQQVMEQ